MIHDFMGQSDTGRDYVDSLKNGPKLLNEISKGEINAFD